MTDPVLRWAILGTSFISRTMASAIQRSPGSVITAVFGRDPIRLAEFQKDYDIAHGSGSLEAITCRPDVDIVYVGLPNHLHHLGTAAGAREGKAVLSEKSLTVTLAEADHLLDAVVDRVFFVEGLMYLAHPVIRAFVDVLQSGRIGDLRAVHASYSADIAHLVNPQGGGAVFNLGCYPASLLQLVIDSVHGSGAFARNDMHAYGVRSADGNIGEAVAAAQFDCGVLATLRTAETHGMAHRFDVHGTNGVLSFESNPWLPGAQDNSFAWDPYHGQREVFAVADGLDAFDHQVRMVERAVREGRLEAERPSPRPKDSRELIEFLVQWERSAAEAIRTKGIGRMAP